MILGHNYASSCEIEVAAKLFHRQINVWLECKNSDNIITHVLTKFESDSTLTHDQPIHLLLRHQHYQYLTPRSEMPFMKLNSSASNSVTNAVPSDQIRGQTNKKYQQNYCFQGYGYENASNSNTCELDICPNFKNTENTNTCAQKSTDKILAKENVGNHIFFRACLCKYGCRKKL